MVETLSAGRPVWRVQFWQLNWKTDLSGSSARTERGIKSSPRATAHFQLHDRILFIPAGIPRQNPRDRMDPAGQRLCPVFTAGSGAERARKNLTCPYQYRQREATLEPGSKSFICQKSVWLVGFRELSKAGLQCSQ